MISGGGARLSEGKEDLVLETNEIMSLYPNPVRNKLVQVSGYLTSDAHLRLRIYDMTGAEVLLDDMGEVTAGDFHKELDVTRLATGQYVVRFERSGFETISKRLTIE